MRVRVYLSFNPGRERRSEIVRLLRSVLGSLDGLSDADSFAPAYFGSYFDGDDPSRQRLQAALEAVGISWSERCEHLYTVDELTSVPLLELGISCKSVDGGGPEYGTEYDVSAGCPRCGTGAIQTSPLMLPPAGLPKKGLVCTTHVDHILVGEPLAEALRRACLSGLELRRSRCYRNNEPVPWWQMISTYTMPRMSPQTKGLVRDTDPGWGCPVCERDMYCGTPAHPLEIVYDPRQLDPAALPDVVQTWECFGRSVLHDDPERNLIRGVAQPLLLVSQNVFRIFRELKVKHVKFTPVRINIDD